MSKHRHGHDFLSMNLRTSKKEQPCTSGSSPPFSSAEGIVTPSTPAGKTLFRPAPPLDFFWADILAFCKPKCKLSIKHLKTIIKFFDWPEAYSEFSKSAPVMSSSCRSYKNHVKDTQGQGHSRSRTLKVTGIHAMHDGSAWFLRIIISSLHAFLCLLSVKKQKHDIHLFPLLCNTLTLIILDITTTSANNCL